MRRGTTPTHIFEVPFDVSMIKSVKIFYAQGDVIVFEKLTEDCELNGNTIKTTLTQEDTLKLDHKKPVEIQLRILTLDGKALASLVERVGVDKMIDNEVLV
jgi:hypothetical protein